MRIFFVYHLEKFISYKSHTDREYEEHNGLKADLAELYVGVLEAYDKCKYDNSNDVIDYGGGHYGRADFAL